MPHPQTTTERLVARYRGLSATDAESAPEGLDLLVCEFKNYAIDDALEVGGADEAALEAKADTDALAEAGGEAQIRYLIGAGGEAVAGRIESVIDNPGVDPDAIA